jgi:hypothetical protein
VWGTGHTHTHTHTHTRYLTVENPRTDTQIVKTSAKGNLHSLSALTNHNKQYFKPNLLFVPAYRRGGHCSISRTLQKNSRGLAPPRGLQTHESIFTCRTLLTWVMPSCPGSGPLFTCRTQLLDSSPSCLAVSRMTLSTSLFT